MKAFLARPDGGGPFPAVVVIHEIYGMNENIRGIARRFAAAGYAALAVDLFSPGNRALCLLQVMGGMLLRPLDNPGLTNLHAALDWLRHQPHVDSARTGAIGFCMGGGYALALACTDQALKASAVFYGMNPRPLDAVANACPLVGSYPEKDFTRGAALKLQEALTRFEVPHDIKIYPEARHSFFNDQGKAYHPDAAADAWTRTLNFFAQQLRS